MARHGCIGALTCDSEYRLRNESVLQGPGAQQRPAGKEILNHFLEKKTIATS
jgi:hypothetical protein